MRTGKLNISRGFALRASEDREPHLTLVPSADEPAPASECPRSPSGTAPHLQPIEDRIKLLERLARLRAEEILSAEEFAAQKAALLAEPCGQAEFPRPTPLKRHQEQLGPPLAGRLFSWKLLPVGLVAGLALSFGSQPQETMRLFDQALSLLGA